MAKGTKFSFILAGWPSIYWTTLPTACWGFANRHANSTVTSTEVAETNNYSQAEVH